MAEAADAIHESGQTALHRAVRTGDQPLVQRLLEAGADLEARTQQAAQTPLHLAAAAGHAGLVPLLITPTTLDAQDADHHTALQLAVRSRSLAAASALVMAGASQGAAQLADTPLILAVRAHRMCCKAKLPCTAKLPLLLLKALLADPGSAGLVGEVVRWRDGQDRTALHLAASAGCPQLVAQLSKAGADKETVDSRGATPLWRAAAAGHAALVPLLATPANINLADQQAGDSPLHVASRGKGQRVAALLAAGAVVDTRDRSNHTPVYVAALGCHTKQVVPLLLAALSKECRQHQGQQQQAHHQHSQGDQQPGQGRARLVELVAAPVVPLAKRLQHSPRCSQLLGVVLDVLGLGVAGEVCLQVQQQLQEQQGGPGGAARGTQASYLAEALLRGLLWEEQALHAARQPLVARLQRLVPGVGAAGQQQQQREEEEVPGGQEGSRSPLEQEERRSQLSQVQVLLKEAALAAAAGQEREAQRLLGEFAALHRQQQQVHNGQQWNWPWYDAPSVKCQREEAFRKAAAAQLQQEGQAGKVRARAEFRARSFRPPGLYTTFLAAWVGVQRQLRQLPQEVAVTVVAAVMAAQEQDNQQQGGQEEQQQQVWDPQPAAGRSGASHEACLSPCLPDLLLEGRQAACREAPGSG